MNFRYAHVSIRVVDLEKSLDFYVGQLGMIETRRKEYPEDGFALVFLSDKKGVFELELTYNYNHAPYEIGDGFAHLAFYVGEFEESYEKLKSAGYEVSEFSGLPGSKPNYYFVTDPDGYQVEMIREK